MAIDPDSAARAMERHPDRAQALLAVLRSVEDGEMSADGPAGAALVQQMRGALSALAALADDVEGDVAST